MPPIFMTLLTVSLDFSLRVGNCRICPCHKCEDLHNIKALTARLSATVRCDAVAGYLDPISRQLRVARFHRHRSRGMLIPSRIFVIAFQSIAHFDHRHHPAHRNVIAERPGKAFHRDRIFRHRHRLGHFPHVHAGVSHRHVCRQAAVLVFRPDPPA